MEVLIFQKEAFEEMAAKFNSFSNRVNELLAKQGCKSLNRWLDNQEVCQQLNISPLVSFSTLLATLSLTYSKVSFIRKFFPDTSPPFVMFLYFRLEALVGSILPFRPSPPCTSTGAVLLSW